MVGFEKEEEDSGEENKRFPLSNLQGFEKSTPLLRKEHD